MYHSVLEVKKIAGLSFFKIKLQVASAYILQQSSDMLNKNTGGVKQCEANQKL